MAVIDNTYNTYTSDANIQVVGAPDEFGRFRMGYIVITPKEDENSFSLGFAEVATWLRDYLSYVWLPQYMVHDNTQAIFNAVPLRKFWCGTCKSVNCYFHAVKNFTGNHAKKKFTDAEANQLK